MGKSILFTYLGRKKRLLVISGILSVFSTVMQFAPFYCIYRIIELLMTGNFATGEMVQWSIYSIASVVVAMVLLYASSMCSHVAAFDILYEIRMDLLKHLSKIPMGYFTENSSGQMIKQIDQSVEKMESFIAHQIPDLVSALVFPLFYIGVMLTINWKLGLISLLPIFVAVFLYAFLMSTTMKDNTVKQYHDALEEMNSNGVEYVRAMPAVKVFGLNVENFKSFHDSIQDYKVLVVAWTKNFRSGYVLYTTLITSVALFVMPLGVFLISNDSSNRSLTLTVMLAIILASGTNAPFMKLMYAASTFSNVNEGVKRLDAMFEVGVIEERNTVQEFENTYIEFDHVVFSYVKDAPVIHDVSFTLQPNTMNALVGPSGGGKSTIAQLLLRFYELDSGVIRIGGVDIRDVTTKTLMNYVSFVFQDVTLFSDSIEENIRMGNVDATFDEVVHVAKLARCYDFIMELPDQFNTKIGEHGIFVSKGEAQRLSIARALLKNAPILVLDEATAYADAENEVAIQQSINTLVQGKTVLIIAHRLWTIQHVDQILVCNNGVLEASGTHEELLLSNELYTKLWNINSETNEWEVRENHA